jgi:hypothetical protein
MSSFKELDFSGIKGVSIATRKSKVRVGQLGRPVEPEATIGQFLETLPDVLAAADLKKLARRVVEAREEGAHVVWMIGGHVIKCGVAPLLVDLMGRGLITAVAMNGAAAVHDFELAMWGHTSEDVEEALGRAEFGMTEETAQHMNKAVTQGAGCGWGIGEALGRALEALDPGNPGGSVLLNGWKLRIPVTVHVAIGTDVVHQHPSLDPAALGTGSYTDFRIFAGCVAALDGGVLINAGSAVIMPEVFLKAFSIARRLGGDFGNLTTANLDFIQHYRPTVNVLRRPVAAGGEGFALTGHHEILIPLLACAIKLAAQKTSGSV